ncbi:radical SAM protein [Nonomuraea sp. NPDC002799]
MHRIEPRAVHHIRGENCYWAIGTKRVARLPMDCVDERGDLTDEARAAVEAANLSPAPDPDLFHITAVITTQCNLACSYCFQNTELPGPDHVGAPARIPQLWLNEERIPRILAFTRERMRRRGATKLEIMLFGGEPTLRVGVCERLLDNARELGLVKAAMITNGTLMKPAAVARLARAGLRSAQITFDGDLPVHDQIRVTHNGRGSFDRIVGNLAASQDTEIAWGLRVNLTGQSIDGTRSLLDRLATRLDPARFAIYFAPVNDGGIGFADTLQASRELGRRVGELSLHAMDLGFTLPLPSASSCLACGEVGGETGAVINADGTLFSCWESVGQDGYQVGTVDDGYLADEVIDPRWVSCGYSAEQRPDGSFADTVNAMVLDRMHAAGLLGGVRR